MGPHVIIIAVQEQNPFEAFLAILIGNLMVARKIVFLHVGIKQPSARIDRIYARIAGFNLPHVKCIIGNLPGNKIPQILRRVISGLAVDHECKPRFICIERRVIILSHSNWEGKTVEHFSEVTSTYSIAPIIMFVHAVKFHSDSSIADPATAHNFI